MFFITDLYTLDQKTELKADECHICKTPVFLTKEWQKKAKRKKRRDISEQIYYYCCHSQLLPIDNKTLDFQKWNQIVMIGSGQIGSSHDFRKKQEVTQKQQISSEQNPSKT